MPWYVYDGGVSFGIFNTFVIEWKLYREKISIITNRNVCIRFKYCLFTLR